MKKTMTCLAVLAMLGIANAINVTNLFPNGDFESGGAGAWVEGGCDLFSYPTTEGNPGGYGIIDDSSPCWGIWVGGDTTPLSLASLGLTAGQTYTFVQDMKIISGTSIGGVKIESWNTNSAGTWFHVGNSGDMRPLSGTGDWATYSFTYTISPAAKGLKIVPLWGPSSVVGYDNLGVVLVGATPLSVSIIGPTNSQVVNSNFTITATATVSPGTVTNVGFYIDNVLVGNATAAPFGYIASGVSAGAHALKAVARDSAGNSATSAVVNVTVTSAPPPPFLVYEPFNYGSLANGEPSTGAGLAGNWTCSAPGSIVSGLTYSGLPTANSALQSSSGHQLVSLANPPSGIDTVWVSFLFKQAGDNGGNRDGLVLVDSFGKGVMFAYQQFQTTLGKPAIAPISSYTTVGTQLNPFSANNQTYADNNFYVLRLVYTGGALSSVAVYSNPTAGGTIPPAADFTVTSGLSGIGAINTLGLVHQGAMSITVDEIRMGSTFADVVGGNLTPTVPTTLSLVLNASKNVSWSASSTNYYQPQKSSDNSSWTDLGPLLFGSPVTSVTDPAPENFYQVLELESQNLEQIADGSVETDGGGGTAFYWNGLGSQPPTRSTDDFHSGSACLSLFVTNVDATAQTCEPQQNLIAAGQPGITGGNTYTFSFWAKSLPKDPAGGYVQQYKVTWLNAGSAVVGAEGFANFTSSTNAWTETSTGPVVAPTNAVNALIQIRCATGGISNDFGGVLIDDVSLRGFAPGGVINTLSPTIQNGQIFIATVLNNGLTATDAQGTIQFKTNNVGQGTKDVASGLAVSDPAIMPANFSVTAIYSGDATYIGSSATVVVGNVVNPTRTNLVSSVSGNQLTLSWPASHIGWSLQAQTNSRSVGLGATWFDVSGSTATNQMTMTVNPANPTVFYRLKYTP